MKKNILFLFVIIITVNLHAQELTEIMYVANKKGLNVYEKPFPDAKITGKLSYGQKVIAFEWSEEYHCSINQAIDKEGLDSCWQLIKYNHKKGYIINTYLLPTAPPAKGVTTIEQYFKQLSSIAGRAEVKRPSYWGDYSKILYKNGMEAYMTYESEVYSLPNFSVQQAFLLLRLLKYKSMVTENDTLPVSTTKGEDGSSLYEAFIKERQFQVERDNGIQKISINEVMEQYIRIYKSPETNQTIIFWYEELPGC